MKEISRHNPEFGGQPEQSACPAKMSEVDASMAMSPVSITRGISSAFGRMFRRRQEHQDVPASTSEYTEVPSLSEQAVTADEYPDRPYNEVIDDMRMETSVLAPAEQAKLRDIAIAVKDSFAEKYRAFMVEGTTAKADGIEDRVIALEAEQFKTFYGEWDSSGDIPEDSVQGFTFPNDGIIALRDPKEFWGNFRSETQTFFSEHFGDEETAQKKVTEVLTHNYLAHEVIHQFQDDSLPNAFLEAGTYYYQRQMVKRYITDDTTEKIIATYAQALDAHGEDVHKLFFGQKVDQASKNKIIRNVLGGVSAIGTQITANTDTD
jgi:hypothetical protein